jgi:hypothetical protein
MAELNSAVLAYGSHVNYSQDSAQFDPNLEQSLSQPENSPPPEPIPAVEVVEPDPTWPDQFQQICAELKSYLDIGKAPYLRIEHVGSTAVPELPAKPSSSRWQTKNMQNWPE